MILGTDSTELPKAKGRARPGAGRPAGFTMMELVITAGLGVLVLGALYLLLERNVVLFDRGQAKTDVQQSTRIVLEDMGTMLRAAGNGVPRGTVAGGPAALYIFYNGITAGGEPLVTSATAVTFLGDVDGTAAQLTSTVSTGATTVSLAPAQRDYSTSLTGGTNTVVVSDMPLGGGVWAFGQYAGGAGPQSSLTVASLQSPSGAAATFSPGGGVAALEVVKYSLQGTNLVRRIGLYGGQTSATNPVIAWGPAETLLDNVVSLAFAYYDITNSPVAPPAAPGDQGNIRLVRVALQARAGLGVPDYTFSIDVRLRAL